MTTTRDTRHESVIISEARALWDPAGVYCNTASYGLPPRPGWEALQSALGDWHGGRTSWEHWGASTEAARATFARLVGVEAARVAVGSTVSELFGSVITALPAGARVAVPDIEFTSILFPLLCSGDWTSAPLLSNGWSTPLLTVLRRSRSAPCR